MSTVTAFLSFYEEDFQQTLFPLYTNRVLITEAFEAISAYVYSRITAREPASASFLIQERVYAAKLGHHLRRTQKLDPISEFFAYDLVHRNRAQFRKDVFPNRQNFGYRFKNGVAESTADAYTAFRNAGKAAGLQFKYVAKFDISNYFNSIYHHDIMSWFADLAVTDDDSTMFGKFLRQINAGRSIDCLVHGLYPTKLLGSHFLSFVDNHPALESELLLRFIDDFCLYSNDISKLTRDFLLIQKLLGEKGLSINPSKTHIGDTSDNSIEARMNPVRAGLLRRRRVVIRSMYWEQEEEEDADVANVLSEAEQEYLMGLLNSATLEETDADLVLSYLREQGNDLLKHLNDILWRFPYLSKHVYLFSAFISDKAGLLRTLDSFVSTNPVLSEYSLFWLAHIVETHLLDQSGVGGLVTKLYEHPEATRITRAKLLEIPERRHGLRELREEAMRTGSSDWLSWSAAVGCRRDSKASRNHLLNYFKNGSEINTLIAECVKKIA